MWLRGGPGGGVALFDVSDPLNATPLGGISLPATVRDIGIKALPAANRSEGRLDFHPRGRDNGYLINLSGVRVFVSGDTAHAAADGEPARSPTRTSAPESRRLSAWARPWAPPATTLRPKGSPRSTPRSCARLGGSKSGASNASAAAGDGLCVWSLGSRGSGNTGATRSGAEAGREGAEVDLLA